MIIKKNTDGQTNKNTDSQRIIKIKQPNKQPNKQNKQGNKQTKRNKQTNKQTKTYKQKKGSK